jgi:hypothetical protein
MMDIVAIKHDKSTVGKTTQESNTAAKRDTIPAEITMALAATTKSPGVGPGPS